MSVIYEPPCGTCGKGVRVRVETDGMGRTYDVLEQACEHERKRRGVCRHCERPVDGKPGYTLYCRGHRRRVKAVAARRYARRKYRADPKGEASKKRALYWGDPVRERQRKRNRYAIRKAARRQAHTHRSTT